MKLPSQSALTAAIALDPTSANAYLNPEPYRQTLGGKPSSWPQECEAELYRVAEQIDKAFAAERALTRDAVVDLIQEFEMIRGFALFGPDSLRRFAAVVEEARRVVSAPPKPNG